MSKTSQITGVLYACAAALLFGASTPFSKILLGKIDPVLTAALLYLGSGSGLTVWWLIRSQFKVTKSKEARLKSIDIKWLAGATLSGGIVAPVLLMAGLAITAASSASLLLNLESVLTALLAWFVFKENFDRRIAWGMALITSGSLILSWTGKAEVGSLLGSLLIASACLAWGIDNNLTRKISAGDPIQIAAAKGIVAGIVNFAIAMIRGADIPGALTVLAAALVGLLGYGVSLTLFILALRYIGTARTSAYFSLAPFAGAIIAIAVLGDPLTVQFLVAALLMGVGIWLHLTEKHLHKHRHKPLEHEHKHIHDEHHQHEHSEQILMGESHSHQHEHKEIIHHHPHYPDIHHQHEH